jgi:hypothetical protein
MSEDRVWRQESGVTAAGARATDDVVGEAKKAFDEKRQNDWKKTPSRRDRQRGVSRGVSGTTLGTGPVGVADEPSAEDARKAMDAKKRDAWKTPSRKDRERQR